LGQDVGVPRALSRYVLAWALVGAAGGAALLTVTPPRWSPELATDPWLLPLLAVTALLLHGGAIRFQDTGEDGEAQNLDELVLIASLLLLPPPWPWIVMVGAVLVTEVRERRGLLRGSFNLGCYSTATIAAIVAHASVPAQDPFGPLGLLAATGALAVFATTNWVAMAGIKVHLGVQQDRRAALLETKLRVAVTASAAVGALGVIAAFLLGTAPLLAPLLAVPLVLVRQRSSARRAADTARREDHRRLERTVAGASDGILLVDAEGRVAVWNDAMARLTGVPSERALGRVPRSVLDFEPILDPPAGSEATHQLVTSDGDRQLVAVERSSVDLGADDRGAVVLVRDVTSEAEAAMMREDLISRVSHELRTPLSAVTGFLETVTTRWTDLDDRTRLELLDRALAAGHRLTRLTDGLLARGRLDHGGGEPTPVAVRLDDVVDELVAELQGPLSLDVSRRRSSVEVTVDLDHLAQILTALLENAVRYGRPPVEIATERDGATALLVVRDHGEGVPEAFRARLFVPFAQASTGLRRTARGLGLGLSIARELAEANGGTLRYAPTSGDGARFELVLPRAPSRSVSLSPASDGTAAARAPRADRAARADRAERAGATGAPLRAAGVLPPA
jgi:PAS domain S-box-containing protein